MKYTTLNLNNARVTHVLGDTVFICVFQCNPFEDPIRDIKPMQAVICEDFDAQVGTFTAFEPISVEVPVNALSTNTVPLYDIVKGSYTFTKPMAAFSTIEEAEAFYQSEKEVVLSEMKNTISTYETFIENF